MMIIARLNQRVRRRETPEKFRVLIEAKRQTLFIRTACTYYNLRNRVCYGRIIVGKVAARVRFTYYFTLRLSSTFKRNPLCFGKILFIQCLRTRHVNNYVSKMFNFQNVEKP